MNKKLLTLAACSLLLVATGCAPGPEEDATGLPEGLAEPSIDVPTFSPPDPDVVESDLFCKDAVSWSRAGTKVGQSASVKGPVVSIRTDPSSGTTFLNIGADYPDPHRFTAVIFSHVRDDFPEDLETEFGGQTVCMLGDIRNYQGAYQMELLDEGLVVIYVEP